MSPLEQFLAHAGEVEAAAAAEFAAVTDGRALTDAQNKFLGRSNSERARLLSELGGLGGSDKPEAGRRYNAVVKGMEQLLADAASRVASTRPPAAVVADKSMPAREQWRGSVHPITAVIDEIIAIFRELGFTIALGPEVEHEWYNFGALNFPADHPAMDLHDTLYVDRPGLLLRTHTSPVQVRTLQRYAPPIRVLAPGNVFRRDFFDATHAPAFMQLEGLAVDEGVSFADLKATLTAFVHRFYGPRVGVRFGPSYFPFTEPSAQMDVEFDPGDGKGKRWIEILGCGLVHPAVLENAGIDSEKYSGWAFGMGPARIAMSRHGVPDIRLFYDSDVRFLEQFR
jgi:phenylalanyl-tRNA synthetase alpha chain